MAKLRRARDPLELRRFGDALEVVLSVDTIVFGFAFEHALGDAVVHAVVALASANLPRPVPPTLPDFFVPVPSAPASAFLKKPVVSGWKVPDIMRNAVYTFLSILLRVGVAGPPSLSSMMPCARRR